MSQSEKPAENEGSVEVTRPPAGAKHKVIADLHSGMVLLAPVATKIEDLPAEPEDLVNSRAVKGSAS